MSSVQNSHDHEVVPHDFDPKATIAADAANDQDDPDQGVVDAREAEVAKWQDDAATDRPRNLRLDPVDFWGASAVDAPDLPAGLLPPVIESYARDNAERIGINPAAIAFPCLAVVATAIREGWKIQPKLVETGWTEEAITWIGISGFSGVKKTAAVRVATAPLNAIQRRWQEEVRELFKEHKDEMERHKLDMAAWRKGGCEGPSPDAPTPPPDIRLVYSDATIETLIELAKDNPSGLLLERDELMGWIASFGKYSGDPDSDKKKYLSAYNGDSDTVDRMTRKTFARRVAVSVVGGIQDDVVQKKFAKLDHDGFLSRFILVQAVRAPGCDRAPDKKIEGDYIRLIESLSGMEGPGARVKMSPGAVAVRERLESFAESCQDMDWVNPGLRDHLSKWAGMFARLCLIWHMCESQQPDGEPVSMEIAERVYELMTRFLLPEAQRVHCHLLDKSRGESVVEQVADMILATRAETIKTRDVVQRIKALRESSRDLDEAFRTLETMAWIKPASRFAKTGKVREWTVNARAHVLFASRAERLAARAKRAQDSAKKFAAAMAEVA